MNLDLGIITGSLSPAAGGLYESVRVPARILAESGMRVAAYGLQDAQYADVREEWGEVALVAPLPIGPARLGYSPETKQRVLAANHDIVHQHGLWFAQSRATLAWSRASGKPTVISPRGMLDPWSLKTSPLKKRIAAWLYESNNLAEATVLHALNANEHDAIRSYGLKNPVAIIPNGVFLPEISGEKAVNATTEETDRRTLLFLGRIHEKKGIRELLLAWKLAGEQSVEFRDKWQLVLAGWSDDHQARTPAIDPELVGLLADRVRVVGPKYGTEKEAQFARASAFVLPSFGEGMPMAALEAMAWKLPVFVTPQCNLADVVEAGAGVEISSDPKLLCQQLVSGLQDENRLLDMGNRAREIIVRNYTWDRVVSDMTSLYGWVAGKVDRPDFIHLID